MYFRTGVDLYEDYEFSPGMKFNPPVSAPSSGAFPKFKPFTSKLPYSDEVLEARVNTCLENVEKVEKDEMNWYSSVKQSKSSKPIK